MTTLLPALRSIALSFCLLFGITACSQQSKSTAETQRANKEYEVQKSEDEWRAALTDQEYEVLREQGTERAFTSDLLDNKKEGVYTCAACQNPLYESDTKFNSGTGWPSFFTAIHGNVGEVVDDSYGMSRTEIICNRCGSHLGHVFNDGPPPTGMRHCVNGISLDFEEK